MKKLLFLLFALSCFKQVNAQIITTVAGGGTASYTNGISATAVQLDTISAIAVDALGNIYFGASSMVFKVSTSGIITSIAGTDTVGYSGDGGAATLAQINITSGLAVDDTGNVYITDANAGVVRKINTSGIIDVIAGGNWGASTNGDGGPATDAFLDFPVGLAIDKKGNIYISDEIDAVVRKINTLGIISTFAGNGLDPSMGGDYSGDGGQATDAGLHYPSCLAVDTIGNLYISDWQDGVVRKVNTAGIINTFAGIGNTGAYTGDGGFATAAGMPGAASITTDITGNVYISCIYNSLSNINMIRKVNT